jgi:hypothetical protein
LDKKTLAVLAKRFADGVPEDEFSVAGLQGCECLFGLSVLYGRCLPFCLHLSLFRLPSSSFRRFVPHRHLHVSFVCSLSLHLGSASVFVAFSDEG